MRGTFVSGHVLRCSTVTSVKVTEGAFAVRDVVIAVVMSSMDSTSVPLTAITVLSRRVERQYGIRADGVDGLHGLKISWLLSGWRVMSIPSVGSLPLVLIVTSAEGPKGLGESSKLSGTPELVQISGSLSSSSGMIWGKLLFSGVEWFVCIGISEDRKRLLLVG